VGNRVTLSRRQFSGLASSLAFTALSGRSLLSAEEVVKAAPPKLPSSHIAFLSDTHIAGDASTEARGVKMADHLQRVVQECLDRLPASSHVIVNGDCAYLKGESEDYKTFAKLVTPLKEAGHTLHLTMGNHDDREPMYAALNEQKSLDIGVDEKHVGLIALDGVDLVLLDSLWKVNEVTGQLGDGQRDWLSTYLSSDSTKPVIVIGHHNLQLDPVKNDSKPGGLVDTDALSQLLFAHPRVRAYFYGHTHRWHVDQLSSADQSSRLQLVNLPPVAYVFDKKQPSGWVHGEMKGDTMKLTLHSLDDSHAKHGETAEVDIAA
jgi:3',5'-cyclic-AMP phosphodiesterase